MDFSPTAPIYVARFRAETQLFSDKNHLFPHSPGLAIRISISYFPADCYKGSIFYQLFQTAFQNTTCFLKYSKYKKKRLAIGRAFPSMVFCKYRKYKHPVFATFSTVVNYFPRFDFDRIFQSAVIMKPGALTSSLPTDWKPSSHCVSMLSGPFFPKKMRLAVRFGPLSPSVRFPVRVSVWVRTTLRIQNSSNSPSAAISRYPLHHLLKKQINNTNDNKIN